MDKIIITTAGSALIVFIYWFFFAKKETVGSANGAETVIVDGGYKPSRILVPAGFTDKPVYLNFIRRDPNPCLEELIFPDYKIKTYLPLNRKVTVKLNPPHPFTTDFHCGMNMYFGKLETTGGVKP